MTGNSHSQDHATFVAPNRFFGTSDRSLPLLHCRYEGMFKDGQRHSYGALYYATGASYEGEWQHEQKHGRGVFTFEDGTVFDGIFAQDQAVLKEGQAWGPVGLGVKLRVHELLEDGDNKQACPCAMLY